MIVCWSKDASSSSRITTPSISVAERLPSTGETFPKAVDIAAGPPAEASEAVAGSLDLASNRSRRRCRQKRKAICNTTNNKHQGNIKNEKNSIGKLNNDSKVNRPSNSAIRRNLSTSAFCMIWVPAKSGLPDHPVVREYPRFAPIVTRPPGSHTWCQRSTG